jgi:hypothetical protein
MKFSSLAAAAFVSWHNKKQKTGSSSQLALLPPPLPLPPSSEVGVIFQTYVEPSTTTPASFLKSGIVAFVQGTLLVPPAFAASEVAAPLPPTKDEIKLLQEALAVFYGVDQDLNVAEQLLSQAIKAWKSQPPDEQAGLYRVRADCYMV